MRRCLLIAPLEAHATAGRIAAIAASGFELHVIDVSSQKLRFNLDQHPFTEIKSYVHHQSSGGNRVSLYFHKFLTTLRCFGLVSEKKSLIKAFSLEISKINPSVVVTYYGPIGIYYARVIKSINRKLPIVSILNLIPSSLDYSSGIKSFFLNKMNSELANYRHTLRKLDFIVTASDEMTEYVIAQYGVKRERIQVVPDYFPKSMSFKPSDVVEQAKSSLIFLGAPERWGGEIDDIDIQFSEIAQSGLTIYSGKLADSVIGTNNIFCYPLFTDAEVFSGHLMTFANQFKASLITYGVNARHQRFKTTLPTRFFSSISAGIPLAVKAGLFDAIESYINKYSIGFTYSDTDQLKSNISDLDSMKLFKKNAANHSKLFFAENQGDIFKKIFLNIISK